MDPREAVVLARAADLVAVADPALAEGVEQEDLQLGLVQVSADAGYAELVEGGEGRVREGERAAQRLESGRGIEHDRLAAGLGEGEPGGEPAQAGTRDECGAVRVHEHNATSGAVPGRRRRGRFVVGSAADLRVVLEED